MGDESCLPLMPVLDADIVIPPSDVELGEMSGILEIIDKVRDEEKGVNISDGICSGSNSLGRGYLFFQ